MQSPFILTDSSGAYYFRTIKPVPYPGRTPHIHFKVKKGERELLTTQCYIKGHPGNPQDSIWKDTDPQARESITIDFAPVSGSPIGELAAKHGGLPGAVIARLDVGLQDREHGVP